MPVYESECRDCGAKGTYFRTIAERKNTPACERCGGVTDQIISAVRGFADIPEYISPATGKVIRGRRQRQYDLESSGCRPYEGTESEMREAKRKREYADKANEARLDAVLGKTIEELDASNRLTRTSDRSDPLPETKGMRVLS